MFCFFLRKLTGQRSVFTQKGRIRYEKNRTDVWLNHRPKGYQPFYVKCSQIMQFR